MGGEPQTLASGLAAPWSVVPIGDGGALISQRDDGRVLELTPAGDLREAGTIPGVVSGGESGLHGLAMLEDGAEAWLYAYHGAEDDNRVVRMPLQGDPGALALGESEVVIEGIPRANTHDGGRLAFGPDGFLYVSTGDAQRREAPQDPAALGGKILRLTPEGEPAPGNPWDNAVWTLGHRNVQGLAWTSDGTMWASEFGQNTWDELNRIDAGANYGWPVVEGRPAATGWWTPWSRGRRARRARAESPRTVTRCSSRDCGANGCGRSTPPPVLSPPSRWPSSRANRAGSATPWPLPTARCGCSRTTRMAGESARGGRPAAETPAGARDMSGIEVLPRTTGTTVKP
nr:hypothetical protein GCM10025699_28460 [Microbacterium flavescens]